MSLSQQAAYRVLYFISRNCIPASYAPEETVLRLKAFVVIVGLFALMGAPYFPIQRCTIFPANTFSREMPLWKQPTAFAPRPNSKVEIVPPKPKTGIDQGFFSRPRKKTAFGRTILFKVLGLEVTRWLVPGRLAGKYLEIFHGIAEKDL